MNQLKQRIMASSKECDKEELGASLTSLPDSRKRRREDAPSYEEMERETLMHSESNLVESEAKMSDVAKLSATIKICTKRIGQVESDCPETAAGVKIDESPTRPRKKGHLEFDDTQTNRQISKPSLLFRLPLELLAEILIFTGSPQHVLAVARTCKAFCHTLLEKHAQYIWRTARRGSGCSFNPDIIAHNDTFWTDFGSDFSSFTNSTTFVTLPNPPRNFSEAAYAAFLYDPGPCEVR